MWIRPLAVLTAVGVVIATIAACSGADPDGPTLVGYASDAGSSTSSSTGGQCVSKMVTPIADPTTLPSCCTTGAGHCVPSDNVDPFLAQQLATCTGGYCEPDPLIEDPTMVLKTCTSLGNAPGACVSKCVPQVQQYITLLPQDVCADDEKCAPCTNPLDNTDTHACEIGKQTAANTCSGEGGAATSEAGATGGACPYTGPALVDPTMFPACQPACGGSHCVPSALVPAAQQSQLITCTSTGGAAGYCAPDTLVQSGGNGLPPTCVSVAGAEGRCLSQCIPLVSSKADVLPRATCADTERCAPCYDPTAADPTAPTGACSIACDAPKAPPTVLTCPYTGTELVDPSIFPACAPACAGAHCVPTALVPTSQQAQLAACTGGFCTPDTLSSSGGNAVPPTCTSIAGAEGRCLSECLPLISSQASLLPTDTCGANEKCAPCFNPTAADPTVPTGACSIACDKPAKPPVILQCPYTGANLVDPSVFPACTPACGGAHCVPSALVPTAQQAQLATCPGGFCAPDSVTEKAGEGVPASCVPFDDPASEGRCTSDCLPAIQAQASQLAQKTCATGELCAPCFDPFTGVSTGACNLACDAPAKPKFTFPTCCTSTDGTSTPEGTCVPKSQVPTAQQGSLEANTCPTNAANYLCVPSEYLPAPDTKGTVMTCTAAIGGIVPAGAGACVSKCANTSVGGVLFVQGTCPDNHLCIGCSTAAAAGMTIPGCQ